MTKEAIIGIAMPVIAYGDAGSASSFMMVVRDDAMRKDDRKCAQ